MSQTWVDILREAASSGGHYTVPLQQQTNEQANAVFELMDRGLIREATDRYGHDAGGVSLTLTEEGWVAAQWRQHG